jgi:hypothetical protein
MTPQTQIFVVLSLPEGSELLHHLIEQHFLFYVQAQLPVPVTTYEK